jgi:tRNA(Ile)-lysidine synthase
MAAGDPLREQVRQTLARCPGGLVLAVSGGPDSVALLRAALAERPSPEYPLVLAHLNHQLRGQESDGDEAFVVALHQRLCAEGAEQLECVCSRIDVAAAARQCGENLEATARQLRYDWLLLVAKERKLGWIATGHTATDQAETVLHRLLRGAGWQGLRGIAACRPLADGVELVRPLLTVGRPDVLAYLHELGQPYRHDSSNDDLGHTRNRIRHELLPLLARDYNPAIVAILGRLGELAQDTYQAEIDSAAELLQAAELPRAGRLLIFDRKRLAAAARHRVRSLFRLVWQREGWPVARMGRDAWERLAGVVFGEVPAVDLPGPIHARRRRGVIQVGVLDTPRKRQ